MDDGPDALQVRFESSRRDVVRVAMTAADDAGLAANLTLLGHT
jgi:hypothetical protein